MTRIKSASIAFECLLTRGNARWLVTGAARARIPTGLMPWLFRIGSGRCLRGRPPASMEMPQTSRDFCFVANAVQMNLCAALAGWWGDGGGEFLLFWAG